MLSKSLVALLPFLGLTVSSPLEERDTCNRDNVLRCLIGAPAIATPYCSSYLPIGVVTSYTTTVTPVTTATTTTTVTVTAAAVKRAAGVATTIYAGSPVTIVGPDSTSVVLNRRMFHVEARATTSPAPTCLAQYSPAPTRITSACNCLSITSRTLSTASTAPTSTTTTTVTATTTVAPPPVSHCPRCNICTSDADCQPGFECDAYVNFSFGDVSLCTTKDIESASDICSSICT
ncbi:MAG: hypothetical protein Q9195_009426 [Heterodermia aff. obscurata]